MNKKYCLVCTPRSGSYYVLEHIARHFGFENGKEWFGRVKKVHFDGMKTSPVDIDHSVNEDLLTNKEMTLRLLYLKNYSNPFIIKCMPFQITKTGERDNISYEESQDIAAKYMKNFSLIYMETRDKLSQFCFDVISKNQDYVKRNLTSYDPKVREIPKPQSLTATKEHFISFMERQNYVKDFRERNYKGEPLIYWEDFKNDPDKEMDKIGTYYRLMGFNDKYKKIIPHEDYEKIFKNFREIEKWFK